MKNIVKVYLILILIGGTFFACSQYDTEIAQPQATANATVMTEAEAEVRVVEDSRKIDNFVLNYEKEHPNYHEEMKTFLQSANSDTNTTTANQNKFDGIGEVFNVVGMIQNHYYDGKYNISGASLQGIMTRIKESTDQILQAVGEIPGSTLILQGNSLLGQANDKISLNDPKAAYYDILAAYNDYKQAFPRSILNIVAAEEMMLYCRYIIVNHTSGYAAKKVAFALYSASAYSHARDIAALINQKQNEDFNNFTSQALIACNATGVSRFNVYSYFYSKINLWKPGRNVPFTLINCSLVGTHGALHMSKDGYLIDYRNSQWNGDFVCYYPNNQVATFYKNATITANQDGTSGIGISYTVGSFNYPCFNHPDMERRILNSDNNTVQNTYLTWGPPQYFKQFSVIPPVSIYPFHLIPYGDDGYCVIDNSGHFMTEDKVINQGLYTWTKDDYNYGGIFETTPNRVDGQAPSIQIKRADGSIVR